MLNINSIHRAWQSHLGDCWSSVNALLRLSADHGGRAARISRWTHTDLALKGWEDLEPMLSQIVRQMWSPGTVEVVDEKPTLDMWAEDVWNKIYFPTVVTWPSATERAPENRFVTYQWDGRYNGHLNNPPDEHIEQFRRAFPNSVRLGRPLEIDEIVHQLYESDAFVGIDSGIAHIARSVGTPMFLCEYRGNLDVTQKLPGYTRCKDIPDALVKMRLARTQ